MAKRLEGFRSATCPEERQPHAVSVFVAKFLSQAMELDLS